MTRRFTQSVLLGFLLCFGHMVFGQAGSYSLTIDSIVYSQLGAGATTVAVLHDDVAETDVPIGFNFVFEGVIYDTVAATSDGFLSFIKGASTATTNDLDNGSATRRPLVAPLWDDLDGRANLSNASYEVTGTAPNRVFTFEWRHWEWNYNSSDSVVSFQAKLYETTNIIEFAYRWECSSCRSSPSASIGLSGASSFLSVTGEDVGNPTASNSLEDNNIDTIVTNRVYRFTPPPCPAPSALVDSNITTTSIDLGWQSGGSGPWYIWYGPCGFNQASATQDIDTSATNTHTLTGLTPGVAYQIYLFEACGANLSDTIDGGCVNTLCLTQTLPFVETFDLGFGCFTAIDSGTTTDTWQPLPAGGSTNLSGDFDGTGYIVADSDEAGPGVTMNEYLLSPVIDASSIAGSLILDFDQWYNNIGSDRADVEVWDGTQWVLLLSQNSDAGTGFTGFDHQSINITPYANANLQVRFHYYNAVYAWHWAIDNFSVRDVVCAASSSPFAYAVSADSIAINWIPGSGSTVNYGIEYGALGFSPGSGTTRSTVDTFAVFNSLTPDTRYDFYIYDSCSTGNSLPLGPFTVKTLCLPVGLPFTEGFNSSSTTEGCWTVLDLNNDADFWNMNYSSNPLNGDQVAALYTDFNGGNNDDYLITPTLPLTGNEQLIYYYRVQSSFEPNDFMVLISPTGINPADFTDTLLPLASYGNTTYMKQVIDISAYSGNHHIAWHVPPGGLDGWRVYIDSVVVEALPPCPDPTMLTANNILPFSADLSWTQPNGSSWNIEWGPQGFNQGSGVGTVVNGVTNPYNLSSLGADSCYDYYVQQDCGVNGTSAWIGPFTFCTPPTCPAPTNLGVDLLSITLNTADIYWTPGLATNFNIEYGMSGFARGSGSRAQSTNDTLTLSNLASGTEYEFWVRDSCSATDTSAWSGPFSFITAFNTNYLDDFNQSSPFGWLEATGRITNNTVFTGAGSSWGQDNFGNSGSSSQRINLYFGGQYDWLISPSIYLDPVKTNLQAEFDVSISQYNSNSQGYLNGTDDTLALVISTDNGVTWSKADILWHTDVNDTVDVAGEHVVVPLTGYTGYVRFGFYGGSVIDDVPDNDLYVDNFEVRTPPACPNPTALSVSSVKADSATVYWTEGTSGFVGATVFVTTAGQPASAGTQVSATNDTVVLAGLNPSTSYCVYVVEQCAGGFSDTIGPICFNTLCLPLTAPYAQNFDGVTAPDIPACWATIAPSANTIQTVTSTDHSVAIPTAPNALEMNDASSGVDDIVISPEFSDLPSGLNRVRVKIAYEGGGTTFNDTLFFGTIDGQTPGSNFVHYDTLLLGSTTGSFAEYIFDMDQTALIGTNTFVAFSYAIAGGGYEFFFDDFFYEAIPSANCPGATNVAVAGLSCDSAVVSWTADVNATSTYLVYGAKGFTLPGGTVVPNVSSPYTINSLSLNTEYDVYLIDSCGSSISIPVGPVSFKTDSVGPVLASFTFVQSDTTLTDATVDFNASASQGDGLSYSWDFDNGNNGNGVNASATYTANQPYNVTLTVTDRCGNTDDTTITVNVSNISIVENLYDISIDVYPNPSEGNFKVKVGGSNIDFAIEVTDLSGKLIHQRSGLRSGEEQYIDLGDVAAGVYILRFEGQGLHATQRITIE